MLANYDKREIFVVCYSPSLLAGQINNAVFSSVVKDIIILKSSATYILGQKTKNIE